MSGIQFVRQQTKHASSYINLQQINEAPKRIALNATSLSRYISQFLSTSKGKDKFMAMLQYTFELHHSCNKHSNIPQIRQLLAYGELRGLIVAEQFKDSISQARKIFRLLYFLEEIKGIQRVFKQNKPIVFKILALLGHYTSFMYYISDNLMWIVGILVQSGLVNPSEEHKWKLKKNSFSQSRIVLNIIRLVCVLKMRQSKHSRIETQLSKSNDQKLCLSLIKLRRKTRFEILDLVLSLLRFFMLMKSLKMRGYQYLDVVFVSACGFVSSALDLVKAVYEKKIYIQLDVQTPTDKQRMNISKGFQSTGNIEDL